MRLEQSAPVRARPRFFSLSKWPLRQHQKDESTRSRRGRSAPALIERPQCATALATARTIPSVISLAVQLYVRSEGWKTSV